MENFIIAFNVVVPLFILIILGYLIRKVELITETSLKELNSLVYNVFLPVLLFNNMYHISFDGEIEFGIILYSVISILLIFGILCLIVPIFEKQRKKASTMIQGMYRSNFALFGIAVTESMYGAGNAGITGILVAVIVPLFNILAVCLFEIYKGDKVNINGIIRGIIRNPLLIGTLSGFIFKVSGIIFPVVIEQSLEKVGSLATPVALIVLGGTFKFGKLIENRKRLIVIVFVRLILIPFVFIILSILYGYREKELFALYIMFGSPTAVASFAMAGAMGGDAEMAGQIVVLTTIMSLFSCILGIFVMKAVGVI